MEMRGSGPNRASELKNSWLHTGFPASLSVFPYQLSPV